MMDKIKKALKDEGYNHRAYLEDDNIVIEKAIRVDIFTNNNGEKMYIVKSK